MFFRNWNKDLFNIPTLLTLFRLCLIPVYMTIYLEGSHLLAGAILALSCLTDKWSCTPGSGKAGTGSEDWGC